MATMTNTEVLSKLQSLTAEQQIDWTIRLGNDLTINARGGYPFEGESADIDLLMTFNEIQHKLFDRLQHLRSGEEWPLESFVDFLFEQAQARGVTAQLEDAMRRSLSILPRLARLPN